MERIALVSPKGPLYRHRGGIWKKSLRYQPLTLTTLAALIPADFPHTVQLIDDKERLLSLEKSSIRSLVVETKSPMPVYAGKLSDAEIADVIAYLLTLRGQ